MRRILRKGYPFPMLAAEEASGKWVLICCACSLLKTRKGRERNGTETKNQRRAYRDKKCKNIESYLLFPLSYIEFAKEETNLFRLLFISDMDLDMSEANDFYKELGNEEKAKAFSQIIGVEPKQGKEIFLDLFLYSHGIAVLTATGKLSFDSRNLEKMLQNFLSAYVKQEREKAGISYGIQSLSN